MVNKNRLIYIITSRYTRVSAIPFITRLERKHVVRCRHVNRIISTNEEEINSTNYVCS